MYQTNKNYRTNNSVMIRSIFSCYLAQNTAIRLADEVLRYHDHDTSRCQVKIS